MEAATGSGVRSIFVWIEPAVFLAAGIGIAEIGEFFENEIEFRIAEIVEFVIGIGRSGHGDGNQDGEDRVRASPAGEARPG